MKNGKICTSCGIWKRYEFFTDYQKINKAGQEVTYYYSKCKDCVNASYRANYVKTKTPRKKKIDYKKIGRVQQEATEHGMSYGKWVAQQYIKEEREKNGRTIDRADEHI